jgi:K+-transporting ATPase KdpF subunit
LSALSADNIVGLIVSVLLVAYLVVALLLPERF